MFTAESKGNTTAQLGYGTKKWGAALGYRYGQCAGFGTAYELWRLWQRQCRLPELCS